jgi:hypothetical protein
MNMNKQAEETRHEHTMFRPGKETVALFYPTVGGVQVSRQLEVRGLLGCDHIYCLLLTRASAGRDVVRVSIGWEETCPPLILQPGCQGTNLFICVSWR